MSEECINSCSKWRHILAHFTFKTNHFSSIARLHKQLTSTYAVVPLIWKSVNFRRSLRSNQRTNHTAVCGRVSDKRLPNYHQILWRSSFEISSSKREFCTGRLNDCHALLSWVYVTTFPPVTSTFFDRSG